MYEKGACFSSSFCRSSGESRRPASVAEMQHPLPTTITLTNHTHTLLVEARVEEVGGLGAGSTIIYIISGVWARSTRSTMRPGRGSRLWRPRPRSPSPPATGARRKSCASPRPLRRRGRAYPWHQGRCRRRRRRSSSAPSMTKARANRHFQTRLPVLSRCRCLWTRQG
jgi:hypothetical protein